MNIFYLDENHETCAQYHCDKHVIKMILETAQLLCCVHWVSGVEAPYKKTHVNHPSSVWARESLTNYKWLCKLGKALCKEYTYRYEKTHKTESVIDWCIKNLPNIADEGFTKFKLAMPDEFKTDDPVKSYRNYYVNAKKDFLTYKKRKTPNFVVESMEVK